MKINIKKAISLLVCICFVFSFCMSGIVNAESSGKIDESMVKVIQNDDKVCTVMATYKGDELYATLDKETDEITMQTVEKPKVSVFGLSLGKDKITDYKVAVDTLNDSEVSAVITDIETSKEYKISENTDKVKAQAVVIIPIIDIFAGLAMRVLAGAVLTTVIAGITYYALENLIDDVRNSQYDYFTAKVWNNIVWIGAAIPRSKAIERMKLGQSIVTKNNALAYDVAWRASGFKTPVGPEISGVGSSYFYHYHLYGRANASHAFFLD